MRIAVPSDDGVLLSPFPSRALSFVVAEVALGEVVQVEYRANTFRPTCYARARRDSWRTRYSAVADTLRDCQVVIAHSMGIPFRRLLARRGIEVVITSEPLVDRAITLFALMLLRDESSVDGDDQEEVDLTVPPVQAPPSPDDGFDA